MDQRSLTGKKKYGSSDQLFYVQSGVSIIDKRDNDPSLRDMVKLQTRVTQGFCDVKSYWILPTYQFKRGLAEPEHVIQNLDFETKLSQSL